MGVFIAVRKNLYTGGRCTLNKEITTQVFIKN
jgi:hypothetical protein